MNERRNATAHTLALQQNFLCGNFLDNSNIADFADADRGFIARIDERTIKNHQGGDIWFDDTYAFLEETRDAKSWAGYIHDAIEEFGGQFDTVFLTHNWPVWGAQRKFFV